MKADNAMDDTEKGIQIERGHRISHTRSSKDAKEPRQIIVKFSRWKHRQNIWAGAKNLSADHKVKIKEDLSARVRFQRWKLGEIMIDFKKAGKQAQLKFDKLVIEKVVFKYHEGTEMFENLKDKQLYKFDHDSVKMTCVGPLLE